MLFSYKQIASLNNTETKIYEYVIKNTEKVLEMNIRQFADANFVSTATLSRFFKKCECDGFVDFKYQLKEYTRNSTLPSYDEEINIIEDFFDYTKTDVFDEQIHTFVDYNQKAKNITFMGIGTSGILGEFGARYFSNVGYYAICINDPYYPPNTSDDENVLIILSESGETREILDQIRIHQGKKTKILAITSERDSTIDRMADASIYYFVPSIILPQTYNISTQIPVLYIIERLTRELQNTNQRSLPIRTSTRND